MARDAWLVKSEPTVYAFEQLVKDGRTAWDGIRNYEARNNLRAMKRDPVQRYATWPEFALELSKVGELVLPPGAIPDSEKYVTLKKVPMLAPLADSELWELARAGKWARVAKGKAVVQEDQKGRSFFFCLKATDWCR